MLFNKTTGKKIIERVKYAEGFFGRFKGLMFERKSRFDYALVFEVPQSGIANISIHSFFVFFKFDAVFLDKEKKVVDLAISLKPFVSFFAPKKPSKYLIELPEEKAREIKIGHYLDWNQ